MIEWDLLHTKVVRDFATSIKILTQSFLMVAEKTCNVDEVITQLMDQHHECLLKHCKITYHEFKTTYQDIHKLSQFPTNRPRHSGWSQNNPWTASSGNTRSSYWGAGPPADRPQTQEDDATDAAVQPPETTQPNEFDHASLYRALEAVFITAWDEYLTKCWKNAISLNLKKLEAQHFLEKATADASMDIDNEAAVSHPQLKELISKMMQEENK
jgi:hypothetical protein